MHNKTEKTLVSILIEINILSLVGCELLSLVNLFAILIKLGGMK